jgi:hypothetical protein
MTALQQQASASSSQQPTEALPQPPEPEAEPTDEPDPLPQEPAQATKLPQKPNVKLVDLAAEPASFVRQREALLRLARYWKRMPTREEALKYIQEERLCTGAWSENSSQRGARGNSILQVIAPTFDSSKCAKGSVNVDKYDAWAHKHFPHGLAGRTRSSMSEEGDIIPGQPIHVSARFIAVFLSICEFALLMDKNQDESLPHRRAEALWTSLELQGLITVPSCARKWAVCRDELERHGLIQVTDRNYRPGQAMKWEVGAYFPGLGLWKQQKAVRLLGSSLQPIQERRREEVNCFNGNGTLGVMG